MAPNPPPTSSLSPREAEIVARLANGEPQKAIAAELGISIRAVETYIDRAKEKVSAVTVIQLVVIVTGEAAPCRNEQKEA